MSLQFSESGKENSNNLVLVHAYPLNRSFWDAQIKELGKYAHVLALDLPGFGESPALLPKEEVSDEREFPKLGHFVESIAQFLEQQGIKKAVFAGCSWGGYILFELWRRYPERVQGLILCNTRADAETAEGKEGRYKTIEQVRREGTKAMSETMVTRVFSERMRGIHTDKVQQVKDWILSAPIAGVVDGNKAIATRADSLPTLATINVPTLLICGTEDPITGEAVMKPIREGIKDANYVLIKDAGHLAPFDSPNEVNAAFVEFMKQFAL